ncbi:MAG: UDP-N-acetylmuramoyl-L-alanine--D-glutamate ligase [Casimicrobium sp.]
MTIAYAGAKVNVVGLGATGLSLVRFLSARGANVSVFDGDANAAGRDVLTRDFPHVSFTQFDVERDALPACDWIALSPGVPRASHALSGAQKQGKMIIGDIELFAQLNGANKPIIAITGSNGKTTTAQLTGAIAKSAGIDVCVAGNVGLPVLDAATQRPNTQAWVLEVSSFQLESTSSLECDTATVLNVTANHLDRYPSFFAYAASKERIYARAKRQVVNRDDAWSSSMRRFHGDARSFGASEPQRDDEFGLRKKSSRVALCKGARDIVDSDTLRLRGTHNLMNAMAALALTDSLNVSDDAIRSALTSFEGVAHRYEWLGQVTGIDVINDSKATTVVATTAALNGTQTPVWLIVGGDGKGQSFDDLASAAAKSCRAVHVIGKDADAICAALSTCGVSHRKFASLEDAVTAALDAAKQGDTLLLSPACASWDMFRNFEHRAQVFADTVTAWAKARGAALSKEHAHA